MKIILNGDFTDKKEIISIDNRAFQFGDGVFETILYSNKNLRFYEDHYNRLTAGMSALSLSLTELKSEVLKEQLLSLCELENLTLARIKIMVWRQNGSLPGYQTETNEINFAIYATENFGPQVKMMNSLMRSTKVKLTQTISSQYKTLSSLPYVLAGIEKKDRNLDDLVITDFQDQVSECCSSNLFWITNDQLFTPPLSTGCVNGIMRRQLMKNFKVSEINITYNDLLNQGTIFSTNVAQLSIFNRIDQTSLKVDHPVLESIKQLWAL